MTHTSKHILVNKTNQLKTGANLWAAAQGPTGSKFDHQILEVQLIIASNFLIFRFCFYLTTFLLKFDFYKTIFSIWFCKL